MTAHPSRAEAHRRLRGSAQENTREPLFILAPARSYSTVAVALLSGHPDLFGFPEMLLFPTCTIAQLVRTPQPKSPGQWDYDTWRFAGLTAIYRAIAELHQHNQSVEAISRARAWLDERSSWPSTELMNHLLDLIEPRIGVEQSPQTTASDNALAACLAAYPRARYIHLTRHPVDMQASARKHWRSLGIHAGEPSRALAAMAASAWYLSHNRIVRALLAMPEERWLRVRGEDLIGQPRAFLPIILDWLSLPWNDKIVADMLHTERWPFAGIDHLPVSGGDPSFLASPQLRQISSPGPVVFDRALGYPDEMCRRMTLLANYLGYQ